MEVILDRRISDRRVFPSIDIHRSGTRKEELLLNEKELSRVWLLRKVLQPMGIVEAMELLVSKVTETEGNEAFLDSMNA